MSHQRCCDKAQISTSYGAAAAGGDELKIRESVQKHIHAKRHIRQKMAATLCGRILPRTGWLPLAQSVRHGSKAVTRHRKPMHILKQKLMAVTEYIPPKPTVPPGALAPHTRKTDQESGLVKLLKKEVETMFRECKMIAVVQNNATSAEDMLLLKHRLHRYDITIRFFPNQVIRSFLPSSQYSNMQPLFIGQTAMLVSKEPKVKEMLRVLKSSPQMILLGGCIENTLLSREGILNYSRLPSIITVHGELVGGLTMMTSQTVSMLQRHPAHLSALLQQYIKQQQSADAPESTVQSSPKTEQAAV
ncbi:39S ribosomal protein L10, mitochondrial isoform X1 [Colossoma macropomum]|uniref:39S ribosomal protein L10, mitochondrial isoform X1 n=2 Tax=Colossoma macropomum TaxID=42526 RepID=UPI0018645D32|nr:39S ribosomal protein L10, mitochondrial isoform X1 [Colossoma macropomum]